MTSSDEWTSKDGKTYFSVERSHNPTPVLNNISHDLTYAEGDGHTWSLPTSTPQLELTLRVTRSLDRVE